jgi:hypothetical protein
LNDAGEQDDEAAGDGRYTLRFGIEKPAEDVELLVTVESPTFMREKRFRMVVHEHLDALVEHGPDGPVLAIALQEAVMQPDAIISAWQEISPGERMPLDVSGTDGVWQAPLIDAVSPSYVQLSGTTRLGTLIERRLGPFMPTGIELPPAIEAPPVAPPVVAETPLPEVSEPVVETEPEVFAEEEEGSASWILPAAVFGAFNVLLIIGGLLWFFIRRRSTKATESNLDDLIDETESRGGSGEIRENAA